jgi:hypothetical protein
MDGQSALSPAAPKVSAGGIAGAPCNTLCQSPQSRRPASCQNKNENRNTSADKRDYKSGPRLSRRPSVAPRRMNNCDQLALSTGPSGFPAYDSLLAAAFSCTQLRRRRSPAHHTTTGRDYKPLTFQSLCLTRIFTSGSRKWHALQRCLKRCPNSSQKLRPSYGKKHSGCRLPRITLRKKQVPRPANSKGGLAPALHYQTLIILP